MQQFTQYIKKNRFSCHYHQLVKTGIRPYFTVLVTNTQILTH